MDEQATTELDPLAAQDLIVRVAKVFTPRMPVSNRDFFAGRLEQLETIADAVSQSGLHVVIYGERGVGKTSLANIIEPLIHVVDEGDEDQANQSERIVVKVNASTGETFSAIWRKALGEISFNQGRRDAGFGDTRQMEQRSFLDALGIEGDVTVDQIRKSFGALPRAVFVIDEFDRVASRVAPSFTDLIKMLSDFAVPVTVVLVGVSSTVADLIADHESIGRSLVQIELPRMKRKELLDIIQKAERVLEVKFEDDASKLIAHMSQGLPHYTHLLGLHSVREAAKQLRRNVTADDVYRACEKSVKQAQQSITQKHSDAVHSAHKEALYRPILVACAVAASMTADSLGYFNPAAVTRPLSEILDRGVEIATFNRHLGEWIEAKRGNVLERIGQQHSFRYRFGDPLMVPYVLMDAISRGLIDPEQLNQLIEKSPR